MVRIHGHGPWAGAHREKVGRVQYIGLRKLPATGLQGHITAEVMASESDGSV